MAFLTSNGAGWRRAVAGSALAAGLLIGIGVGTAHADVLDDIDATYDTGAGGGQVSNLIHSSLKLRALGFGPSKGNLADLEEAMTKRPNQVPLIDALTETVAFQKRNQARSQQTGPKLNPPTIGVGTVLDPNGGGGISVPINP